MNTTAINAKNGARLAQFQHRVLPWAHAVAGLGIALFFAAILFWFWLKLTPLAGPLNWCFDHYCHRLPDRSLMPFGEVLPVCARCTGVVLGYLLGAIVALCGAERLCLWRLPWAFLFMGLMGVSWLAGWLQWVPASWSFERVVAGMLGGLGGYIFIARSAVLIITWWLSRPPRPVEVR